MPSLVTGDGTPFNFIPLRALLRAGSFQPLFKGAEDGTSGDFLRLLILPSAGQGSS